MEIIWRDVNLKSHKIDLSQAVDIKINGLIINLDRFEKNKSLIITGDCEIILMPVASNAVRIKSLD
jgi:hypothetical protein